jgi:hypothetical protein
VRELFDALGRVLYHVGDHPLVRVGTVADRRAGFLETFDLLLARLDASARFRKLIGNDERRHYGEPRVADLAEGFPKLPDARIELTREPNQMVFLPVVASHAVDAAIYGDADLCHASALLRG